MTFFSLSLTVSISSCPQIFWTRSVLCFACLWLVFGDAAWPQQKLSLSLGVPYSRVRSAGPANVESFQMGLTAQLAFIQSIRKWPFRGGLGGVLVPYGAPPWVGVGSIILYSRAPRPNTFFFDKRRQTNDRTTTNERKNDTHTMEDEANKKFDVGVSLCR